MSLLSVRADVALAMREAVLEGRVFDQNTYSEAIIPASQPMEGWGANEPNWTLILDKCGVGVVARGHVWPALPRSFIQRTRTQALTDTNNELAQTIHAGTPVA